MLNTILPYNSCKIEYSMNHPVRQTTTASLRNLVFSVAAFISCRVSWLLVKAFGGIELTSSVVFNNHDTYLFLSNHQSRLDPFITYGALPISQLWACLPTRPLTAKTIYYGPLHLWLKMMGCYPTQNRTHTVPRTVQLLASGYPVFLFPEGKRTLRRESNPKDGTRLILDQIKAEHIAIKVILVHIEWQRNYRLFRRVSIQMNEAPPAIYNCDVPEIMRRIYRV